MLDLFDQNGHLTDEALQALIREEDLDELQRLEISEHLSFCDACTARYTDLLCDDVLQSPPVPLYGEIMKKVRKKERRLFLRRLTTVSAAACLALVFWWSGVFTFPSKGIDQKSAAGTNCTDKFGRAKAFQSGRNSYQAAAFHIQLWGMDSKFLRAV